MQQIQVYLALLLVTVASPALSFAELEPSSNSVSSSGQPQSVPVVSNSPVAAGQPSGSPAVEVVPQAGPVGVEQQQPPVHHAGPVSVHQSQVHHHQQQHPSVASYYAPAGLMTIVGEQQQPNKPGSPVRSFEQYGQPESASLPPNYKSFGSWGLYIGGNPDGYYSNYYKALSNSVDKQQSGEPVKPAGVVSPASALSPVLRQASSSPYLGADYYPFAYSASDFTTGPTGVPSVSPSSYVSPVQAGAQVYGAPASFESNFASISPYADAYATKKVGAAYAQKEATKEVPVAPSKGYQSRVYSYPPVVPASAPVQPHQVVAYPVPVGSQIVGSQPGADGSFAPYGVHAFTRYAVKPTVVSQDSSAYYYGVQSGQVQPSYKQLPQQHYSLQHPHIHQHQPHQVYSAPVYGSSYYPMSFYGYPLNQLHYSQGSIVGPHPPQGVEGPHHSPAGQPQFEAVSDKVESDDKSKQQKSA